MMRKKILPALLAGIILTAGSFLALSADKRPLAFDDFIKIQRLSDPQISPDGKTIAFVVTAMDKVSNRGNSDIWLVPAVGGQAKKLTSSPFSDNNPRWSPDGKTIAFISSRSGLPQVWLIDPNGGEAVQLTNLATGASGVIWSPDGSKLAFVSSVYPDCASDDCNRQRLEEAEKSKVKARIYDKLLFRHWNTWWDGRRSHIFIYSFSAANSIDATPGDFDAPPLALGGNNDFVFSPDGKKLAFVANLDPQINIGLGTNNDIFIVPVEGGEKQKVTASAACDHSPRFSPDGRYLAYLGMEKPGFEADKLSVRVVDLATMTSTNLTESLDYSASELLWAPDNSALYFTAEEKGRTALFRLILASNKIQKILEGHTISSITISRDGRSLYFLKQAMNKPNDVWTLDLNTRKIRQITDFNASLLSGLEMPQTEEFWFDGASGSRVHGFLLKPPFFDPAKKYPLLMLIHGGPQGSFGDSFHYRWNAQMFASPGYVVSMVNFHGSTGYGQAFTDSISGDWGGKPYEDIIKAVDYLVNNLSYIDKNKIGAAGASYGGYMINWLEGQTDKFKCLVSHSGVFDLRSMYGSTEELWFPEWEFLGTPWTNPEQYARWSPSYYVKNFKTPCLVIHSANDFRVPLEQGLQLFTSLQRMGVPSRFLYFPDEDHFIQKPLNAELWWKTIHQWLATYLK